MQGTIFKYLQGYGRVLTFTFLLLLLLVNAFLSFFLKDLFEDLDTAEIQQGLHYEEMKLQADLDLFSIDIQSQLQSFSSDILLLGKYTHTLIQNKKRFAEINTKAQKSPLLKAKIYHVEDLLSESKLSNQRAQILIGNQKKLSRSLQVEIEKTALLDVLLREFYQSLSYHNNINISYINFGKERYLRTLGSGFEKGLSEIVQEKKIITELERTFQKTSSNKSSDSRPVYFLSSNASKNKDYFLIAYPIASQTPSKIEGALAMLIKKDLFLKKLKSFSEKNRGEVFLTNASDTKVLLSSNEDLNRKDIQNENAFYINSKIQLPELVYSETVDGKGFAIGLLIDKKSLKAPLQGESENSELFDLFVFQNLVLAVGFAISIFLFLILNKRLKAALARINRELDQADSQIDSNSNDEFSYISRAYHWISKKIEKQNTEINFLKESYDNTLVSIGDLIDIYIEENRTIIEFLRNDSEGNSFVINEIYQNLFDLNEIQKWILKLKGSDQDSSNQLKLQLPTVSKTSSLNNKEGKNTFRGIYLVGFSEVHVEYIQEYLHSIFPREQVELLTTDSEIEFSKDKRVIFLLNPTESKRSLDLLSQRTQGYEGQFLISFLESNITQINQFSSPEIQSILGDRILFLNSYFRLKDLYEIANSNSRFLRLAKFTKDIRNESKLENIMFLIVELFADVSPTLKVYITQKEKIVAPAEESIIEDELDVLISAREQLLKDEAKEKIQVIERYYYYFEEFKEAKSYYLIIKTKENFSLLQKALIENVYVTVNSRLKNDNPFLRDSKNIEIVKNIIQEFEHIEFIQSSRQYITINYEDPKKMAKLERIPINLVVDFLKGYFVQPHRSYLVNPTKILKIYSKDKKYFIKLKNEDISISRQQLPAMREEFPYWFNAED